MKDRTNFLFGYGERLTERIPPPRLNPDKAHPYSFAQARERLLPQLEVAAKDTKAARDLTCPGDQTVLALTLHPTYLAKSYYPTKLLSALSMEPIGSKSRVLQVASKPPTSTSRSKKPAAAPRVTSQLFVAVPRSVVADLAPTIEQWQEQQPGADELRRIEELTHVSHLHRARPLPDATPEPLLEVVLHARPLPSYDFVLEGFDALLRSLNLKVNLDQRLYAEGLCFLPVRAPRERIPDIEQFSFLRVVREMPHLRQLQPMIRRVSGIADHDFVPPTGGPVDQSLRVAVFDGGLTANTVLRDAAGQDDLLGDVDFLLRENRKQLRAAALGHMIYQLDGNTEECAKCSDGGPWTDDYSDRISAFQMAHSKEEFRAMRNAASRFVADLLSRAKDQPCR